ncbi:uncharacterized protein RHO17_023858 [Thomomys bottae]
MANGAVMGEGLRRKAVLGPREPQALQGVSRRKVGHRGTPGGPPGDWKEEPEQLPPLQLAGPGQLLLRCPDPRQGRPQPGDPDWGGEASRSSCEPWGRVLEEPLCPVQQSSEEAGPAWRTVKEARGGREAAPSRPRGKMEVLPTNACRLEV